MKSEKRQIIIESIKRVLEEITSGEKRTPKSLWRDCLYLTDFTDIEGTLWDVKIPISKDKQNKYVFNSQRIIKLLKKRYLLGHKSIIDITELEETDAQALSRIVEEEFDRGSFDVIIVLHREDPTKSRRFEKQLY